MLVPLTLDAKKKKKKEKKRKEKQESLQKCLFPVNEKLLEIKQFDVLVHFTFVSFHFHRRVIVSCNCLDMLCICVCWLTEKAQAIILFSTCYSDAGTFLLCTVTDLADGRSCCNLVKDGGSACGDGCLLVVCCHILLIVLYFSTSCPPFLDLQRPLLRGLADPSGVLYLLLD